jgi:hypothetical protein
MSAQGLIPCQLVRRTIATIARNSRWWMSLSEKLVEVENSDSTVRVASASRHREKGWADFAVYHYSDWQMSAGA